MESNLAVQDLLDRQAVTDTLYRYASTIDRKDYEASHQVADGQPDTVVRIVARYHDDLRRVGGNWRIARKDMEVGWRDIQHADQSER